MKKYWSPGEPFYKKLPVDNRFACGRLKDSPENCQCWGENRQNWMHAKLWLFLRFFGSSSKKQHNKILCISRPF